MEGIHPRAAELLKAVEAETGKLTGPFTPAAGALIGTLAVAGILYAYDLNCCWSLAWLGPAIVAALLMERTASEARRRFSLRISQSAILDRLLLGPTELEEIYLWTPWPWSTFFLGHRPRNLQRWIRVVANNVEWYLDEPRTYFRAQWVAKLLALAGPLAFFASSYFMQGSAFDSYRQYFAVVWLVVLGVSVLIMFTAVENAKQLAAMRALRAAIRSRFGTTTTRS